MSTTDILSLINTGDNFMFLYKIEPKLIISRSRTVWKIKLRSFKKSFLALKFTKYFTLSPSDISTGKRKLQIRN